MYDLFQNQVDSNKRIENIADGAVLLPDFALPFEDALINNLKDLLQQAPLETMQTPGGRKMSVLTSSCGEIGWVSDHKGYRYSNINPHTLHPWPDMPDAFTLLASSAAERASFHDFVPDGCLINAYRIGAKLSLHQDKDERDFNAPIVSVSLGLPATFIFGGHRRHDKCQRIRLEHGDVVVWGGPARLRFHGVEEIGHGSHPRLGTKRINLTFRKAL